MKYVSILQDYLEQFAVCEETTTLRKTCFYACTVAIAHYKLDSTLNEYLRTCVVAINAVIQFNFFACSTHLHLKDTED